MRRSSASSTACYHQGAIFGGLVAPVLTYFAINYNLGFGIPMLAAMFVDSLAPHGARDVDDPLELAPLHTAARPPAAREAGGGVQLGRERQGGQR